ncbi:MAG: hypothetical protein JJV95_07495 [Sulfurospirillum sp.]|nr:hypothetical protein [Sulfurospirillum sp.]MBL0703804.1 hypothetical protein [Sulfurospirillum sp.]
MVKKITVFFLYLIFLILSIMYFTPKSNFYYFAEKQLQKIDIIISTETIDDRLLTFKVEYLDVSYNEIQSAKIDSVTIKIFGIYNSLNFENIVLSSVAQSFLPLNIENIHIVYSILNPLNIKIHALGDFGETNIEFNFIGRVLHVVLNPSELMLQDYQHTLQKLNKNENGEFIYDKTF